MPSSRFGRFTVLGTLGAGGMGRVYRAHDPTLQREVAIKVLRDDLAGTQGDLLAEARSASGLNHPNICTIYDIGDVDGSPFIAMELVEGRPLSELIVSGGLPADAVLRLGLQIAGALAHAHEHGIVHGDLKGHNILVTPRGGVKLLDFGLARTLDPVSLESITRPADGVVGGTLSFMAPETLRGARPTPAADVWALGVLLHEMAAGTRPFTGDTAYEVAAAILNEAPHPLPAFVNPTVTTVIARCLEKQTAQRYSTAREPFVALESAPSPPARRMPRVLVLVAAGVVLSLAAGLVWRWLASSAPPPAASRQVSSLIVLPFDNLSRNADEDYFADGMTEALITHLSHIPTLTVISRTSSIRYKTLGKSSREIADELHVGAIVDGTVQRSAGQVRISVRLVDAVSDRNIWARDYTREMKDVLALQGDVARTIAAEIRVSFAPAEDARLARAVAVNPQALEAFLKGRYYWNRRTDDDLTQALAHFRRALQLQPDYAPAYAGIAQCFVVLPALSGVMSAAEALPQAVDAAEHALALDDRLVDAHAALAYARLHMLDFPGAEAGFRRALAINPSDATTHFWYAAALASVRRFEESIDQARQGAALDPVSPIITTGVAWMQHLARHFDQEIASAQAALALEPSFILAHFRLGEGYLGQGRVDDAIAEFEASKNPAVAAYAHGRAGHRREALAGLRTLTDLAASGRGYVSPFSLALIHMGLGNLNEALAWLSRGVDTRAWGTAFLAVEPDYDPLREDPRFAALIARVGH